MRHPVFAATILVLSLSAGAGNEAPGPETPLVLSPMTDRMILDTLPEGAVLESRLDEDFNGDGIVDTAYVARVSREWRKLAVLVGYDDGARTGYEPICEGAMGLYPMGDARLSLRKGVLIVEDLTGGTSAIYSTYRYRYDPGQHDMRLIGDDAQSYSRTNQHDSVKISTNRLTGQRITRRDVLIEPGEGGYEPQPEVREQVDTAPIYMDAAPDPAVTLGWGEDG